MITEKTDLQQIQIARFRTPSLPRLTAQGFVVFALLEPDEQQRADAQKLALVAGAVVEELTDMYAGVKTPPSAVELVGYRKIDDAPADFVKFDLLVNLVGTAKPFEHVEIMIFKGFAAYANFAGAVTDEQRTAVRWEPF